MINNYGTITMKNIKYTFAALLIMAFSHAAMAQSSLSSYFLDGTFHNSKLNPAMKAERGYFSIATGNIALRTKGNVGISDFLFPRGNDELTTFMSGSVSQDEFLGGLPGTSRIGFNLDESIFSCGFRAFGGYATLDLSVHSSTMFMLPKSLFEFAKMGFQKNSYSISDININTMNYAAFTLGYSREVIKGLRVGANLKYLLGLAHADINIDKLNVELNENRWLVESHAAAQGALFCEAYATLDEDDVIDGIETGKMSPASSGFAVDLGVVYDMNDIVPGLTLSASILDLGFINWKYMMKAQSVDTKVEFNGFGTVDYDDMENTVEDELDRLKDDAEELVDFKYEGAESVNTRMNTTIYLGAEYSMPFYKPLSVALLYGQCFSEFESCRWHDVRGYINIAPLKWFEATVNCGFNTYGTSLGWMLNFHPVGFNFFIGSDHMITKVNPQFVPIDDLNSHFTMGINFPIGKRK